MRGVEENRNVQSGREHSSVFVDLVVVGLGYVGLPLARQAVGAGLRTTGYDTCPEVITGLGQGRSHVTDVSDDDLDAMHAAEFTATGDPSVIAEAETVAVCVPTGLDGDGAPCLDTLRAAARTVGQWLRPGTLVVVESTSHPGTVEEIVRPALENASGMITGEDFHLVYSPERIDPGNQRFGISNTPKVVSGCTPLCAKHGSAFYGRFVDSLVVARGTREAEMAKLLENTYRYVNIALVNEMALYCDQVGIDVWDVLHCAATKPFGFSPFSPGPGIGGHCIPVDPLYLAGKASSDGFEFGMLSAARQVHERMPEHVVLRAVELLRSNGIEPAGAGVLLLGVTYKPDVADLRESPAFSVAAGLLARGATVRYHDPHIPEFAPAGDSLCSEPDLSVALAEADLVILLQDHSCYDPPSLARESMLLLDTRGKVAGGRVELL